MITQPETNGTIPEKEQVALKNVRQEILIGEQKVRQLQDALRQVNNEIRTALDTKSQVEEAIVTLKRSKDKVENDTIPLEKRFAELTSECNKLISSVDSLKKEQIQITADIAKKRADLVDERNTFEDEKANHSKSVSELIRAKNAHQERVDRLLKALN